MHKIKNLIQKFDQSVFERVFEFTNLENSVNKSTGKVPSTIPLKPDFLSSNREDPEARPSDANVWDLETIERELIRNFQNKHQLAKFTREGVLLSLAFQKRDNPPVIVNTKLRVQLFFKKYLHTFFLVLCLCLFLLFCGVLITLLVVDLFNLQWQFLQDFWKWLSIGVFSLILPLFVFGLFLLILTGLLDTRLGYFTKLVWDQRTDTSSLNYLAVNINRIMAPFCLNVFRMFDIPDPEFNQIMIPQNVLTIIVENLNRYLSVLLLLFILLKIGNCYKRLRRCFGFGKFKIGNNKTKSEHVEEGASVIESELGKFKSQI